MIPLGQGQKEKVLEIDAGNDCSNDFAIMYISFSNRRTNMPIQQPT